MSGIAVSFQDAEGNRRTTLHFGRMPETGKTTLKAEVKREVERIRDLAFFRKNRCPMRCAELADKAMCTGSGVVEAANKILVAQRMKRSGMRWRTRSGQAVFSFRVLQKSGLFDRTGSDLMAARDAAANENLPLPDRAIATLRRPVNESRTDGAKQTHTPILAYGKTQMNLWRTPEV